MTDKDILTRALVPDENGGYPKMPFYSYRADTPLNMPKWLQKIWDKSFSEESK